MRIEMKLRCKFPIFWLTVYIVASSNLCLILKVSYEMSQKADDSEESEMMMDVRADGWGQKFKGSKSFHVYFLEITLCLIFLFSFMCFF